MQEDKFKKVIQNIGLDEPGASFTDKIMKMIESQEELSLNPALLHVLKNELLAEPSFEFSDNLMANIQPKTKIILEPIITKKTWLIISGIVVSILLLVLINSHSNSNHLHNNPYFPRLSLNLQAIAMGIIKISNSISPSLITLSILLLMDYVIRTRLGQLTSRG